MAVCIIKPGKKRNYKFVFCATFFVCISFCFNVLSNSNPGQTWELTLLSHGNKNDKDNKNILMQQASYLCCVCVDLSTSACSSLIACFVAPYDYNVASVRSEVS